MQTTQNTPKSTGIAVNAGERACINCRNYEQYYRENRGNVKLWVPTSTGYCLKKEARRGALCKPCRCFCWKDRKGVS